MEEKIEEVVYHPWIINIKKDGSKSVSFKSSFFVDFIKYLGFRVLLRNNVKNYVQIQNNIIKPVDKQDMVSAYELWFEENKWDYIDDETDSVLIREAFASKIRMLLSTEMLYLLPQLELNYQNDTKEICFLNYQNTVLEITESNVNLVDYKDLNCCVFTESIIKRDFKLSKKKLEDIDIPFRKFVQNISNKDSTRILAFETVIGYLLHRFQNPSCSKVVFLLDENINELEAVMGGTGKSLFVKALSKMRATCTIDGKKFNGRETFSFQRYSENDSIMVINDIQQVFDFESFYSQVTDGFTVNKKYKPEIYIPFELSPKIVITSNYYPKAPSGNSTERRRYDIELSNHYGKHLNIEQEFGHYFFDDWDSKQWYYFDLYMIYCIQQYLKNGLVEPPQINIQQRKLITEVGLELIEFLDEQLLTKTKLHKKELFADFIRGGYVLSKYQPTQKSFTVRAKKYFEYKNIAYREVPANTKAYFEIIGENSKPQPLTIADVKSEYHTVKTLSQMKKLAVKMQEHFSNSENNILAVDLETTGLDCFCDEIVCMAVCFEKGTGYNIIFPQNKLEALVFIEPIKKYLTSTEIIKVFHNAKFDLKFFAKYGIEIGGKIHDTMILDHLLDPNRKTHGLKEISEIHLNYKQISFKQMTEGKTIREVPLEELTKYACEDTDLTFQLYHFINQKLNKK